MPKRAASQSKLSLPNKRSYKRIWIIVFLLAILAGSLFLFINRGTNSDQTRSNTSTSKQTESPVRGEQNKGDAAAPAEQVPKTAQLKVPFTPQAPTANWDELHNEACEEASMIMAWAYFNNITSLPATKVEEEINKLTEWQKENFGYYLSVNTAEAARMAKEVYDLKTEVVPFSEANIKQALANNKLVVYPAMGQMLGNPYFSGEGPIYHMLVITGYDDDGNYITNDPGTKRGLNYKYSYNTLKAAVGNWVHSAHAVDTSDKRIIIVSK